MTKFEVTLTVQAEADSIQEAGQVGDELARACIEHDNVGSLQCGLTVAQDIEQKPKEDF